MALQKINKNSYVEITKSYKVVADIKLFTQLKG